MDNRRRGLDGIHRALVRTWARFPRMGDTADGIARFWLPEADKGLVLAALNQLVQLGLVQRRGNGEDAVYLAGDRELLRQLACLEPPDAHIPTVQALSHRPS